MNKFFSLMKKILISIIIATILIIVFEYVLKIEINALRIILVYIIFFILDIILWLIKIKKVVFGKIKYSIIMGILEWGISTATIFNLFFNNPFEIYYAIIIYIMFMLGGFIWGITTYSITKIIEEKKLRN
jgi:hypothetical protein